MHRHDLRAYESLDCIMLPLREVAVSPPANTRDFSFLAPCPSSGRIVHGDKDNISSFDSARILSEKLQKQKKFEIIFKTIKGADHFYENHKAEFNSIVDEYIKKRLFDG